MNEYVIWTIYLTNQYPSGLQHPNPSGPRSHTKGHCETREYLLMLHIFGFVISIAEGKARERWDTQQTGVWTDECLCEAYQNTPNRNDICTKITFGPVEAMCVCLCWRVCACVCVTRVASRVKCEKRFLFASNLPRNGPTQTHASPKEALLHTFEICFYFSPENGIMRFASQTHVRRMG